MPLGLQLSDGHDGAVVVRARRTGVDYTDRLIGCNHRIEMGGDGVRRAVLATRDPRDHVARAVAPHDAPGSAQPLRHGLGAGGLATNRRRDLTQFDLQFCRRGGTGPQLGDRPFYRTFASTRGVHPKSNPSASNTAWYWSPLAGL